MGTKLKGKFSNPDIICAAAGMVGVGIILVMWLADEPFSKRLTAEDGVIESLGALFFLMGSALCVIYAARKSANGRLLIVAWAVFCFFCFGEEISWFQRVFNYGTPGIVGDVNRQNEFNIHNLWIFHGGKWLEAISSSKFNLKMLFSSQNLFRIGFFLYFLVLPLFAASAIFRYVRKKMGDGIPRIGLVISMWVPLVLSFVVAAAASDETRTSIAETREMLYAFFIFIYISTHLRIMSKGGHRAVSPSPHLQSAE
jgi:hypothetical protein